MSMNSPWEDIQKPIIGLSPMDGYTDGPFRRICKEINPNILVITEFTSADGLAFAPDKVLKRFSFDSIEHPIIAQIYGGNIETFKKAAELCERLGFDGIDINMGCPAKKVVKSEQGVALRKKCDLAFKLINIVAESTSLSVSVKTRLGWSDASDLISFGKGAYNAGAKCLIIHGRTYMQPYNCPADFNPIYELKKTLPIPIIGNGGIISIQDGFQKLQNLDGFLIGQASIGNPWIFSTNTRPTMHEKISVIKRHLTYMIQETNERQALLDCRKHLLAYIKGFTGASKIRSNIARVQSFDEAIKILDTLDY